MFSEEQYEEWRSSEVTQDLMTQVVEEANGLVATIMNRRTPDQMDDQYLRGAIQALSAISGWKPKMKDAEGKEIDALREDQDEA